MTQLYLGLFPDTIPTECSKPGNLLQLLNQLTEHAQTKFLLAAGGIVTVVPVAYFQDQTIRLPMMADTFEMPALLGYLQELFNLNDLPGLGVYYSFETKEMKIFKLSEFQLYLKHPLLEYIIHLQPHGLVLCHPESQHTIYVSLAIHTYYHFDGPGASCRETILSDAAAPVVVE